MKYFFLLLTVLSVNAHAQQDADGIRLCINNLFEGMRTGDTALIRSSFTGNAVLQTVVSRQGQTKVATEPLDSFLVQVGRPHTGVYDERITFETIKTGGDLASVWTPYRFHIGEKFSHCGVNSFQLVRINGVWKIQYLIDTRRRQHCD